MKKPVIAQSARFVAAAPANLSKLGCAGKALAACIALLLAQSAASAEPITFTPAASPQQGGELQAQIPVQSIGKIALPQGLAVISGHSLEVEAVPEWLFDREPVLTGAVINVSWRNEGANVGLSGLAYFNDGAWIRNLAAPLDRDLITTRSGGQMIGNIQAVLADGVEVLLLAGGRTKVLFDDIADISSSRAWHFRATARSIKLDPASTTMQADAPLITFAPSQTRPGRLQIAGTKVPQSKLPGTEGGVSNLAIALWSIIDLGENVVAPAVATPLIFSNPDNHARELLRLFGARSAGGTGPNR